MLTDKQLKRSIYAVGQTVASVALVGLATAGFIELGSALKLFFLPSDPNQSEQALIVALKGLEFLFLAPLPFIVVYAVTSQLIWITRDSKSSHEDAGREGALIEAKQLVIGLMIAVIGSALIGKLVSGTLDLPSAIGGAAVIVALTAYVFVLGIHARHR
jgi:hypothetical protein